jgi:pyruvate dehydrogenase E2 component (dihydrolipoamide acetyltransferase)
MTPLEFRLPDVGEGIANAEIVAWRVAEGDRVREHDDLVEIQTDKAIVVIPCPASGVVMRLCAAEGDMLDVGAVLAVIEADAITRGAGAGEAAAPAGPPEAAATAVAPAAPAPPGSAAARPLAAPATRRLARELGITLATIAGSGPHGRILREDVERAAGGRDAARNAPGGEPARDAAGRAPSPDAPLRGPSAGPPIATRPGTPTPGQVIPLRGVRRSIALTLMRAWQEVPRVIDYREVDATALMQARARLKQRALERGDGVLAQAMTPTPLIVKAAVRALRDHPYVNASIDLDREEITLHRHYHVGIATAAPDGLLVPVVHDADRKSLAEVALEVAELARAARERRLRPEHLRGATFTVNNYGGLGIWLGTPIVRPPEVANLGVGAVRDQVVAVDGSPVVRPTLVLAVAGDHRVLDGDTLAAFVTQVVQLLEDPVLLLEDLR